jgi:hypothetical protein
MIVNVFDDKYLEKNPGHFVAIVIDVQNAQLGYFDPFGKRPNKELD